MIKERLNKNLFFRFILRGFVVLVIWFFLYYHINPVSKFLDKVVIDNLISQSAFVLDFFYNNVVSSSRVISYEGTEGLYMDRSCNGINIIVLFLGFIIATPGKVRNKIIYSLIGSLVIHYFNLLRIIALFAIFQYNWKWLDFNHKYVFTTLTYLLTFGLWVLWFNKYSGKLNLIKDEKKSH